MWHKSNCPHLTGQHYRGEREDPPWDLGFPHSASAGEEEKRGGVPGERCHHFLGGFLLPFHTQYFFSIFWIPDLWIINCHVVLVVCNKFAVVFRCWANSGSSIFLVKIQIFSCMNRAMKYQAQSVPICLLITLGNWNLAQVYGAHIYPEQFGFPRKSFKRNQCTSLPMFPH